MLGTTTHSKSFKPILFLVLVFLVCFLPRVFFAQVPINVDENHWFFRGSGFWVRVLLGNFQDTYFQHHPGVPTMWLDGFGVLFGCVVDHWFPPHLTLEPESVRSCVRVLREQNFVPIDFYVLTRVIQAVVTSALMTLSSWFVLRLFNLKISIIWLAILTLEPFFLAYQRLVITDSLQCGFILVSVLALFLHWRLGSGKVYLSLSGITMGMAIATKTTTLLLFPGLMAIAILTELNYFQPIFPKKGIAEQAKDIGIWTFCLVATFILIWPAMWVAPFETMSRLVSGLRQETQRGYLFFLGRSHRRINALFYPIVILYRLSPVLLVSSFTSFLLTSLPTWRPRILYQKYLVANFILILSFLWVVSLPGNKLDRYILPIVPFLALNGAIASFIVLKRLQQYLRQYLRQYLTHRHPQILSKSPQTSQVSFNTFVVILLAIQLITIYPFFPYYISYYNPFIGGGKTAKFIIMMGNGEGLDQAGAWLNRQPNPQNLVVAGPYRSAFAPYVQGEVLAVPRHFGGSWTERWLRNANFLLFYINQIQRNIPDPNIIDYFTRQGPLHTVRLNGVDYASIYPGPIARPEEMQTLTSTRDLIGNDQLQLRGYTLASDSLRPGDSLELTLYWDILQSIPSHRHFTLSLQQGERVLMAIPRPILQGFLGDDPIEAGKTIRDYQSLALPATLPPGDYQIGVSLAPSLSPAEDGLLDIRENTPEILGLFQMIPSED
jgi:hypothetical protein